MSAEYASKDNLENVWTLWTDKVWICCRVVAGQWRLCRLALRPQDSLWERTKLKTRTQCFASRRKYFLPKQDFEGKRLPCDCLVTFLPLFFSPPRSPICLCAVSSFSAFHQISLSEVWATGKNLATWKSFHSLCVARGSSFLSLVRFWCKIVLSVMQFALWYSTGISIFSGNRLWKRISFSSEQENKIHED